MNILYIYRHPDMGFSIGRVFHPIEQEMQQYCEVKSLYLPKPNYKPLSLWDNINSVFDVLKKEHFDIIHITGAEHYLLPFLKGYKTIVTVHDLGFYTNQSWSIRSVWKYLLWIRTLKYADRVTFISEKSKVEAKRFVRFKNGQDRVIPNSLGKEFKYVPKKINGNHPIVLHIGTKPNKNLNNTIVALRNFSCHLRIIGKLDKSQEALLRIYNMDYSNSYNLSDDEIIREYVKCDIVNFPSFYEGFGMPIIEGQAIGRIIITSNLSPMKEIAAGSAILADPADVDSILFAYKQAVSNPIYYIDAGLKNVKSYEIGCITREFYNLYKELYL